MKKLWLGITLLSVILGLGIFSGFAMDRIHREISREIFSAGDLAATDWEKANVLADGARAKWEKYRHLASALTDHEPLEEIDSLFSQLRVYALPEEHLQYAAICRALASLAESIGEEQLLLWWNLH